MFTLTLMYTISIDYECHCSSLRMGLDDYGQL